MKEENFSPLPGFELLPLEPKASVLPISRADNKSCYFLGTIVELINGTIIMNWTIQQMYTSLAPAIHSTMRQLSTAVTNSTAGANSTAVLLLFNASSSICKELPEQDKEQVLGICEEEMTQSYEISQLRNEPKLRN